MKNITKSTKPSVPPRSSIKLRQGNMKGKKNVKVKKGVKFNTKIDVKPPSPQVVKKKVRKKALMKKVETKGKRKKKSEREREEVEREREEVVKLPKKTIVKIKDVLKKDSNWTDPPPRSNLFKKLFSCFPKNSSSKFDELDINKINDMETEHIVEKGRSPKNVKKRNSFELKELKKRVKEQEMTIEKKNKLMKKLNNEIDELNFQVISLNNLKNNQKAQEIFKVKSLIPIQPKEKEKEEEEKIGFIKMIKMMSDEIMNINSEDDVKNVDELIDHKNNVLKGFYSDDKNELKLIKNEFGKLSKKVSKKLDVFSSLESILTLYQNLKKSKKKFLTVYKKKGNIIKDHLKEIENFEDFFVSNFEFQEKIGKFKTEIHRLVGLLKMVVTIDLMLFLEKDVVSYKMIIEKCDNTIGVIEKNIKEVYIFLEKQIKSCSVGNGKQISEKNVILKKNQNVYFSLKQRFDTLTSEVHYLKRILQVTKTFKSSNEEIYLKYCNMIVQSDTIQESGKINFVKGQVMYEHIEKLEREKKLITSRKPTDLKISKQFIEKVVKEVNTLSVVEIFKRIKNIDNEFVNLSKDNNVREKFLRILFSYDGNLEEIKKILKLKVVTSNEIIDEKDNSILHYCSYFKNDDYVIYLLNCNNFKCKLGKNKSNKTAKDYSQNPDIFYKFVLTELKEGKEIENVETFKGKVRRSKVIGEGNLLSRKKLVICYEGEWENGKRNGSGKNFYESNGEIKFFGVFKNDMKHGQGIEFSEDGEIIKRGEWREDKMFKDYTNTYVKEYDLSSHKSMMSDPSKMIGTGAFGTVYKLKMKGKVYAFKSFQNYKEIDFKEMKREILIPSRIIHQNIIRIYGISTTYPFGILTEYCEKDVSKIIGKLAKKEITMTFKEKVKILHQLSSAMECIHLNHIIHRDLKWQNILLTKRNIVKVIDFGLSKTVESFKKAVNMTVCGTNFYIAPEIIKGLGYDYRCDVYSFAIMTYELLFETLNPFHGCNLTGGMVEYVIATKNVRPAVPKDTINDENEWLIDLMKRCWSKEVKSRPFFSEIVQIFDTKC